MDLDEVKFEQEDSAKSALKGHPSNFELMLVVKRWARAIAAVCRSHAGKCAEIHACRGDEDPATVAMGTILIALSDHLGLPADGTLLCQDWPEENELRSFVLLVAEAPIKIIDGELITQPTLPRWEPKSGFARRMAGLSTEVDSTPFLSVDETRHVVRGLEESFRTSLLERMGTSFSEACVQLATGGVQHTLAPKSVPFRKSAANRRTLTPEDKAEPKRTALIFAAIRLGLKGDQYCKFLSQNDVFVKFSQLVKGCPKQYPDAYRDDKWKKRIWQERSRYGAKLRNMERDHPRELEKLMEHWVPKSQKSLTSPLETSPRISTKPA